MAEKSKSKKKPETETHIIQTLEGDVKITHPKGGKHHGIKVVLDTDDVVRDQASSFADFLRDYAVVGLAVGFIIGQEANAVMKQLVASFIQPWLTVLFGSNLNNRTATLYHNGAPIVFPWGAFVYTFIEFLVVVIFIYISVKVFRLDKLAKKDEKK